MNSTNRGRGCLLRFPLPRPRHSLTSPRSLAVTAVWLDACARGEGQGHRAQEQTEGALGIRYDHRYVTPNVAFGQHPFASVSLPKLSSAYLWRDDTGRAPRHGILIVARLFAEPRHVIQVTKVCTKEWVDAVPMPLWSMKLTVAESLITTNVVLTS